MSRTNSRNVQTAQLLQSLLYRRTVFAYNIRVVTHHFVPITIGIDASIEEAAIQCTETAETVAGE